MHKCNKKLNAFEEAERKAKRLRRKQLQHGYRWVPCGENEDCPNIKFNDARVKRGKSALRELCKDKSNVRFKF